MFPDFGAIAADIKTAAADLKAGHAASQSTLEDIKLGIGLLITETRATNTLLRTLIEKECYAHGQRNDR